MAAASIHPGLPCCRHRTASQRACRSPLSAWFRMGRLSPSIWTTNNPGVPPFAPRSCVRPVAGRVRCNRNRRRHRDELGEQAVRIVSSTAPQTAVVAPSTDTPGTTRPRTIWPRTGDRGRRSGHEDSNPASSPWRAMAEELSRASSRSPASNRGPGPSILTPGRMAASDGQRKAGHQIGQDRAAHDRQTGRSPLPNQASLGAGTARAIGGAPHANPLPISDVTSRRSAQWHRLPGCKMCTSMPTARAATASRKASPGLSNQRPARRRRPSGQKRTPVIGVAIADGFAPPPRPLATGPCGRSPAVEPSRPPAGAPHRRARPVRSWPGRGRCRRRSRG